jgi:hypothetical protein
VSRAASETKSERHALGEVLGEILERLARLEEKTGLAKRPQSPATPPPPPAEVTCFFPPTRPSRTPSVRTGVDNSGGRGLYRVGVGDYPAGRWSAPLTEAQIAEIKAAGLGDRLATVSVSPQGQPTFAALEAAARRLIAEDMRREPNPGSGPAAELARQVKP